MATRAPATAPRIGNPATRVDARGPFAIATVVIVVVGCQLLRYRTVAPWNSLWAEDLTTYSADAWRLGAWRSIVEPYAGYYQIGTRILALPATFLPVRWLGSYFALAATTTSVLIAVAIYQVSGSILHRRVCRVIVAVIPVALPIAGFENLANITNVNWLFFYATFWGLVATSRDRLDTGLRVTLVLLGATTMPPSIVFLPIAFVIVLWRRDRADRLTGVAFGAVVVVHTLIAYFFADTEARTGTGPLTMIDAFSLRVVSSLVVGERWLPGAWIDHGRLVQVASWVILLAILGVLYTGASVTNRRVAVAAVVGSVLTFVIAFAGRNLSVLAPDAGVFTVGGSRYFVVPSLLLVVAIVVLADAVVGWRAWFAGAVGVVFVGLCLVGFGVAEPRPGAAGWSTQIDAGAAACRDGDATYVAVAAPGLPFEEALRCDVHRTDPRR